MRDEFKSGLRLGVGQVRSASPNSVHKSWWLVAFAGFVIVGLIIVVGQYVHPWALLLTAPFSFVFLKKYDVDKVWKWVLA